MHSTTLLLSTLGALAAAKIHEVQVGSGGLKFDPESVTAEKGDQIHFNINMGHNVAQAMFDAPCKPSGDDAIFSGDERSFTVDVSSTDPLWMYCAVASHCARGMVFAVNPTQDNTVEKFADAAKNAGAGVAPEKAQGGSTGGTMTDSMSMSGSTTGSMSMTSSMSGSMSMITGTDTMSSMSGMMSTAAQSASAAATSAASPGAAAVHGASMEAVLVGLTGVLAFVGLL